MSDADDRAALHRLLEELTTACEQDFCSPATERECLDDESVSLGDGPGVGESAVTFGMIRRARAFLAAVPSKESVALVPETLLEQFDCSVAGVHLLDSPRPHYEAYDKAEWHTRGIKQGLKIARTILEEVLALPHGPAHDEETGTDPVDHS